MKPLLHFTLLLYCFASCSTVQPETYLIPKGFKGKVNVIFNQPKGTGLTYENGKRVYKIPSNGILITKEKDIYGTIQHEYFYIDENGKREKLPILSDEKLKKEKGESGKSEVGIFYDGTTGVYGNSNVSTPLNYQEFYVSDFNGLDSFFTPKVKGDFDKRLEEKIGKW
jgi:hypothetical protein